MSVKPGQVYVNKPVERVFPPKKTYQYNVYRKILDQSVNSPLIFLQYSDFTATRLVKLRQDLVAASNRVVVPPSLDSLTPSTPPPPLLTVVRTSIFGATLRTYPGIDLKEAEKIADVVSGPTAVLMLPTFNPPQLNAVLRTLDRSVPPRKKLTPEELAKIEAEKNADPANPGKRLKKIRKMDPPELVVVGALIEGQMFFPEGMKAMAQMPTIETLRAQIVGLLSAPATQLAMVLSEASGGKLARTLEGLRQGLEETKPQE